MQGQGGCSQDVMGAASRLHLDREPLTALAIAVMLLAFARDRAEQAALRHDSALSVLKKLLQVPNSVNIQLSFKSPGLAYKRLSV